jgi:hypothetical protein
MILTGRRKRGIEALEPVAGKPFLRCVQRMIAFYNKQTLFIIHRRCNAQKGSGHFHIQRSLRCG